MNRLAVRVGLGVAVSAFAFAVGCGGTTTPRFMHAPHLTGKNCGGPGQLVCATCMSCHAGVKEPVMKAFPAPERCASCHKSGASIDGAAVTIKGVRYAGPRAAAPDVAASRAIVFSHKSHMPRPGIREQCMKCHTGAPNDRASGSMYPPMAQCLTCHDQQFTQGDCRQCHQAGDLTRLRPQSLLRHDVAFFRDHGTKATQNQQVCRQCHAQTWCNDCHDPSQTITLEARNPDAIQRELVHRGDFVTRHSIEARSAVATCQRCHQPSFCDACHVRRGVAGNAVGSRNPHPAGWVGRDVSSPAFHGRAAKRDIVTCAACHDQGPATNCILCHRVGAGGGNPHPSGWSSSRSPQSAMCRYCHGG